MHSREWCQGSMAYMTYKDIASNPYEMGSKEYDEWVDGFLTMQEDWEN